MSYFGVRVSTDCDVDRAWRALAQDHIDIIQCHVVNHSVVDVHDLISTPKGTESLKKKKNYIFFIPTPTARCFETTPTSAPFFMLCT